MIKSSKDVNLDESLLKEEAEKSLFNIYKEKLNEVNKLMENREYEKTFSLLASLYEPLDKFFKDIMVNVEDEKIKNNRIALLSSVDKIFKNMLDFSSLVK